MSFIAFETKNIKQVPYFKMLVFRCLQVTQDIKSEFQEDIQVKNKNVGAISTKMAGERMA